MKMTRETRKKVGAILLCLIVMASCLTVMTFAADTCAEGDGGTYDNGFCSVDPSHYQAAKQNADGVYEIANAGNLYWFAKQVDGGACGLSAVLIRDIVVNQNVLADGELNEDGVDGFRTWNPIGSNKNKYLGTFDGANHTISGLYYDNDGTLACYVGLFATVGEDGAVKNVTLADSYIYAESNCGGIAGSNVGGRIENCTNGAVIGTAGSYAGGITGNNNGGAVVGCANSGAVTGENENVGGIVGCNEENGTVERCTNTGTVAGDGNANESYVGGIAGYNHDASIRDCYNTAEVSSDGDYVGGVAGVAYDGTIENCYSTGKISGDDKTDAVLGGHYSAPVITNCYYLADAETDAYTNTTAQTADRFASGEVAYLLNGSTSEGELAWYQTLGTDPSPVLSGDSIVYYGYFICGHSEAVYSNTKDLTHSFTTTASEVQADAATCTAAAAYYVMCDNCDEVSDSLTVSVGDPLGHDDKNSDHDCDRCGEPLSKCADEDDDHLCDVCKTELSKCADENKDHKCDVCGDTLSECADNDSDHLCDICGRVVSFCIDEDEEDHYCDICGDQVVQCYDDDGDRKCDVCGADLDEDLTPSEPSEEPTEPSEEPTEEPTECPQDESCVMAAFPDLNLDAWYHDGVHYCIENSLMNGMDTGLFEPEGMTTRAQLVVILYRIAEQPENAGWTERFDDVSEGEWFYKAVVWANNNGIVNGTSETTFDPNDNVTREQVAAILYRYSGASEGTGDLSAFPDADSVSAYAVPALTWAVGEGLINGVANGEESLLDPTGNAKRVQIATILMRYLTAE